ncbi:endonuclease/exonuclease/phosphatase family protein [Kineococcus sp. GCM10028916]|uniref:endonuclease/exonuclease/phosphatase family protein n=1 Tax=Kineococcus sp. GCM10028916 TaxID=3273394 RepID=UPI00362A61E7
MHLRIASVNAASGRDLASGAVDSFVLTTAVAALDADVVAVQEVDHLLPRSARADQTALLAQATGSTGRFVATVHGTPGTPQGFYPADATVVEEPSYGIALLSRLPVLEWHEERMAPGRAKLPLPVPGAGLRWIPDEPRAVVAAVVETAIGPVSVLGTHLSFSPLRSVAQLRAVRRFAESLPRPLVLLGDLNLPPGVVHRVLPWRPLVTGPTFPAPAPKVQLDHALADGLPDSVRVTARIEQVGGSDHRGVVVDLSFD